MAVPRLLFIASGEFFPRQNAVSIDIANGKIGFVLFLVKLPAFSFGSLFIPSDPFVEKDFSVVDTFATLIPSGLAIVKVPPIK